MCRRRSRATGDATFHDARVTAPSCFGSPAGQPGMAVSSNKAMDAVCLAVGDWDGRCFGKRWLWGRFSTRSNYLNNPDHDCEFAVTRKEVRWRTRACGMAGAMGPSPGSYHVLSLAPAEVCRSRGAATLYQTHQVTQPAFDVTFVATDEDDCQPSFLNILDGRECR